MLDPITRDAVDGIIEVLSCDGLTEEILRQVSEHLQNILSRLG